MERSIVTSNLTKIYRAGYIEVRAVSSVDLQLYKGEIVSLFGPSGSGKTTLLSLIGCILHPTTGSLKIHGDEVTVLGEAALTEIRKKYISFIFQAFNLFSALTAYENVMLALHLKTKGTKAKGPRKKPRKREGKETDIFRKKYTDPPIKTNIEAKEESIGADKKIKGLLTEVGLSERMHFLPRDLSGGQKQRVSVARALVADSSIILADEPTANLDQDNGRKVMEMLRRFAVEHNKCVVVATHDTRLEDIFDRNFIMEDGKIIKERRPS